MPIFTCKHKFTSSKTSKLDIDIISAVDRVINKSQTIYAGIFAVPDLKNLLRLRKKLKKVEPDDLRPVEFFNIYCAFSNVPIRSVDDFDKNELVLTSKSKTYIRRITFAVFLKKKIDIRRQEPLDINDKPTRCLFRSAFKKERDIKDYCDFLTGLGKEIMVISPRKISENNTILSYHNCDEFLEQRRSRVIRNKEEKLKIYSDSGELFYLKEPIGKESIQDSITNLYVEEVCYEPYLPDTYFSIPIVMIMHKPDFLFSTSKTPKIKASSD